MSFLRIVVSLLGLAVLAAVVWAVGRTETAQDFWFEGQALFDQPWGLVAIVNLFAGFACIAIIMMLSERSFIAGALWALPIVVLGNIWTAVWLLIRLPRLADRLSRPDWPAGEKRE
jgi:hypothetical protein